MRRTTGLSLMKLRTMNMVNNFIIFIFFLCSYHIRDLFAEFGEFNNF